MKRSGQWILGLGLAALFLLLGVSCLDRPTLIEPCGSNADCEEGQACNDENACVDASCLSSADCGINQFCAPGFMCEEGCGEDGDCIAGQVCNLESQECEQYGCRDTYLDCDLGEYCDTSTGECYLSDEGHCAPCDASDYGSCGEQGICTAFSDGVECWEDGDCPSGQTCEGGYPSWGVPGSCSAHLCEISCNPEDEVPCPRGYSCIDTSGWGHYSCYGDCMWMYENGYTE